MILHRYDKFECFLCAFLCETKSFCSLTDFLFAWLIEINRDFIAFLTAITNVLLPYFSLLDHQIKIHDFEQRVHEKAAILVEAETLLG